jgi:hypothetical protein
MATVEPAREAQGSFHKAAVSDALKRAGVQWGIGVSIYALPKVELHKGDDTDGQFTWRRKGEKYQVTIDSAGRKRLRAFYEKWLEDKGQAAFGEVLDHGDAPDALGDVDEAPPEGEETPAPALRLVDERADQLRAAARESYAKLVKKPKARTKLPPARFATRLEEASVSHEALEELGKELEQLAEAA